VTINSIFGWESINVSDFYHKQYVSWDPTLVASLMKIDLSDSLTHSDTD